MRIIEEVGYHPNVMARGLVGNKTHVICLIVPEISHVFADYYFSETVSGVLGAMGIESERARAEVRISIGIPTTDVEIERAAKALIAAWQASIK